MDTFLEQLPQNYLFMVISNELCPYSYDWLDNFGQKSPDYLIKGADELQIG